MPGREGDQALLPHQLELSIPRKVGFLLLPGFGLGELGTALAPLRLANEVSRAPLYRPILYASAREGVASEEGPLVTPDRTTGDTGPLPALLLVCAPENATPDPDVTAWLRELARKNLDIGGIIGGASVLAEAGLLIGYQRALPGAEPWDIAEEPVSRFVVDRNRLTCNSLVGAVEMMVHLMTADYGADLTRTVRLSLARLGLHPSLTDREAVLRAHLAQAAPRLLTAIELMEANRETPLTPAALARRTGLSLRHFERLFQEHCGCSPRQYYLNIRLDYARRLLRRTDMLVQDIARAIALQSTSYFSRRYHERFGHPPSRERR